MPHPRLCPLYPLPCQAVNRPLPPELKPTIRILTLNHCTYLDPRIFRPDPGHRETHPRLLENLEPNLLREHEKICFPKRRHKPSGGKSESVALVSWLEEVEGLHRCKLGVKVKVQVAIALLPLDRVTVTLTAHLDLLLIRNSPLPAAGDSCPKSRLSKTTIRESYSPPRGGRLAFRRNMTM